VWDALLDDARRAVHWVEVKAEGAYRGCPRAFALPVN
jgi:hypothetical protein